MTRTAVSTQAYDAARAAAEAIRQLNHATLTDPADFWPSDVYDIVSELQPMAYRIPQACAQLATILTSFVDDEHVRRDGGGDVEEAIGIAVGGLRRAGRLADRGPHDVESAGGESLAEALAGAAMALRDIGYVAEE
jgi:hypothetical protein